MGHKTSFTRTPTGFILPVVIVLSLAITTVSALALRTITTSSKTLDGQYYTTLAREAAQAGIVTATACVDAGTVTWTDAKPLTPQTDCAGTVGTSTVNYVAKDGSWDSTFSVPAAAVTANETSFISTGTVTLRSATGAATQTFTQTIKSVKQRATGRVSKAVGDVSTGSTHACATAEGGAYCWGLNTYGKLGNGTTTNSNSPVAVTSSGVLAGKTVTAISAGPYHTCAVASGKAYCWGLNNRGQLGNLSTTNSSVPVAVYDNPNTVPATPNQPAGCSPTGFFNKCTTIGTPEIPPSQLGNKTVTAITAGEHFTCALAYPTAGSIAETRAYCWGTNTFGQVGNNSGTGYFTTPQRIYESASPESPMYNKTVTAISAGNVHACAIAAGKVYCWGDNVTGQRGDSSLPPMNEPFPPFTSSVNRTYPSECEGTVTNNLGLIGTKPSDIPPAWRPVAVYTGGVLKDKTVTDIDATDYSTHVVADGKVYWWGGIMPEVRNSNRHAYGATCYWSYFDPEQGHNVSGSVWTSVHDVWTFYEYWSNGTPSGPFFNDRDPPSSKTFLRVAGTGGPRLGGVSCGYTVDRAAYCAMEASTFPLSERGRFGDNLTHAGNPGTVAVYTAGALSGKTITDIDTGTSGMFSCVVASEAVYCWGDNTNGRLGTGDTTNRLAPASLDLSTSSAISEEGGTSQGKQIIF